MVTLDGKATACSVATPRTEKEYGKVNYASQMPRNTGRLPCRLAWCAVVLASALPRTSVLREPQSFILTTSTFHTVDLSHPRTLDTTTPLHTYHCSLYLTWTRTTWNTNCIKANVYPRNKRVCDSLTGSRFTCLHVSVHQSIPFTLLTFSFNSSKHGLSLLSNCSPCSSKEISLWRLFEHHFTSSSE